MRVIVVCLLKRGNQKMKITVAFAALIKFKMCILIII